MKFYISYQNFRGYMKLNFNQNLKESDHNEKQETHRSWQPSEYQTQGIWRNSAFPLYDLYSHALAHEPCPRGHDIYNFGRPFFCHHHYILSLYGPCTRVEKKILKETLNLKDYFDGHGLAQDPFPGVIIFRILVDPSLVIITNYIQFVWSMLRSRVEDF